MPEACVALLVFTQGGRQAETEASSDSETLHLLLKTCEIQVCVHLC